jgi:hypothetical protein
VAVVCDVVEGLIKGQEATAHVADVFPFSVCAGSACYRRLRFFGALGGFSDANTFTSARRPLRKKGWIVYPKPPFSSTEPDHSAE